MVPKATECSRAFILRAAMLDVRWSAPTGALLLANVLTIDTTGLEYRDGTTLVPFMLLLVPAPTNGPAYDINVDKLLEKSELELFELNWVDEFCKQSLLDLHEELDAEEFDEDDEEEEEYDGELVFINDELLLLLLLIFTTWAAAHHAAAACIGLAWDFANYFK